MRIFYSSKGAAQLEALVLATRKRIAKKMRFFAKQDNPLAFAKFIALRRLYRFRVGDYRVFFKVEDNTIFVTTVERRDEAYD